MTRTCLCLAPKRVWELEKPKTPLVKMQVSLNTKATRELHTPRKSTREHHALTPAVLAGHLMSARAVQGRRSTGGEGRGGGHHGYHTA